MSRKKRLAAVLVIALVVAFSLTLSVSAAADSVGGGFSLWNLLDGLGGFFIDLINSIGGFFESLINAISSAVSFLLDGLKRLFVPSKESFSKFRDDIINTFDKKVGSIFSALKYLKTRFGGLTGKSGLLESFKITFPKGSFLSGLSIDLIVTPLSVLMFIRGCMTGIYFLETGFIIYHKVIAMANT